MPTVNYYNDVVRPRYPDWNFGPHEHDLAPVRETAQTLDPQNGAQVTRDDDKDIVLRLEGTGGLTGKSAFHDQDEARYFNTSETGWVKLEVDCGETGETTSADFYLEAGIMHNLKFTRVYDTLNDTTLTPKIPANAVLAVTL